MMYLNTHSAIDEVKFDEEETLKFYCNGGFKVAQNSFQNLLFSKIKGGSVPHLQSFLKSKNISPCRFLIISF